MHSKQGDHESAERVLSLELEVEGGKEDLRREPVGSRLSPLFPQTWIDSNIQSSPSSSDLGRHEGGNGIREIDLQSE